MRLWPARRPTPSRHRRKWGCQGLIKCNFSLSAWYFLLHFEERAVCAERGVCSAMPYAVHRASKRLFSSIVHVHSLRKCRMECKWNVSPHFTKPGYSAQDLACDLDKTPNQCQATRPTSQILLFCYKGFESTQVYFYSSHM